MFAILASLAADAAAAAEHDCPKPRTEIKLNSIIAGLFAEGNVPEGSIIDVGALDGAFACFYASLAPQRTVHALDPTESNVHIYRRRYSHKFPNIQPMVGALGEARATISSHHLPKQMNGAMTQVTDIHVAAAKSSSSSGGGKKAVSADDGIQLYAADELFETRWRGERLGFAHIDVEGSELSVLRGMEKQIRRDKPLLTVEVHVHFKPDFTRDLVTFVDSLGYDAHLVEESCGERGSECLFLILLCFCHDASRLTVVCAFVPPRLYTHSALYVLSRARYCNGVRICVCGVYHRHAHGLPQPPLLPTRRALPLAHARSRHQLPGPDQGRRQVHLRAGLPVLQKGRRVLPGGLARRGSPRRPVVLLLAPRAPASERPAAKPGVDESQSG